VLEELGGFLRRVSLPYDLSIHDYTAICPRINLFKTESGYCNEPEEPGCLRCLSTGGALADDILWWRHLGLSLVADADRVLCPSVDAERRVRRYASNARTIVVPHEHQLYRSVRTLRLCRLQASEPLRVAVIGVMNAQKGGGFLLDCIEAAVEIGLSVVWSIVGEFTQPLKTRANALGPRLTTTGSYRVNDVHRLIRIVEPHLILFTQRWPETYSFTLSEALQSGYPILAPEIGSFPERLRGLTGCQLYPIETSAHALAEKLMSVRDTYLTSGEPFIDSAVYAAPKQGFIDFDFYQHHYVRT